MRKFKVSVNGSSYEVEVEEVNGFAPKAAPVATAPASAAAPAPAPAAAPVPAPSAGGHTVSAPMPGTILDVKVKPSETVSAGQILFVLEAMKLENEIMAPCAGRIVSVGAVRGASVNTGDMLCIIEG